MTDARRSLPAVGRILSLPGVEALCAKSPRPVVAAAVRAVVHNARQDPAQAAVNDADWVAAVRSELSRIEQPSLRPVFNATGVVLHTNLGRAPLAQAAVDAIARNAQTSNLEYDLTSGQRGSRYVHCTRLLCELTGAADALVVNNCAAALVLALNTLSEGKEAVVSRGELIEIGGSFRVPDIMARSGAILREVGTTNRTHADDYRRVMGRNTGAIVKVHRSNFEVRGFVAEAGVSDLAAIARDASVPLIMDLGSGLLIPLEDFGLRGEPTVGDVLRSGATLVAMSGDKMLGGPQAGILVGDAAAVAACRGNPLTRALRVDKLTIASLEATLALYRDPSVAVREVPALAMLTAGADSVRTRAVDLASRLSGAGIACEVVATEATVGGGAFPTARLQSFAVAIGGDADRMESRLRAHEAAVVGRVADGRLLLDLRSVPAQFDASFGAAVLGALR